jgi:hypothetical protein
MIGIETYSAMVSAAIPDRMLRTTVRARRIFDLNGQYVTPTAVAFDGDACQEITLSEVKLVTCYHDLIWEKKKHVHQFAMTGKFFILECPGEIVEESAFLALSRIRGRGYGLMASKYENLLSLMAIKAMRGAGFSFEDADKIALQAFTKACDAAIYIEGSDFTKNFNAILNSRIQNEVRNALANGHAHDYRSSHASFEDQSASKQDDRFLSVSGNLAQMFCDLILAGNTPEEARHALMMTEAEFEQTKALLAQELGI